MGGLLAHRWGESPAADQVWAQVAAMAPSHLERRWFLVIQAFIDESVGTDGAIAMAGHVAPVHRWADFSREWENMLRLGLRDERGAYFHMTEMAQSPERMSRVPGFYRLIEKHVGASISVRFNVKDLERARKRIFVPGVPIDWGFVANPWMVAYRALMDFFYSSDARAAAVRIIPPDAVVDFIFDQSMNKKQVREGWESYCAGRPSDVIRRIGREPRFEDDREFLPLQAADLWAWWVRKWHAEGVAAERIIEPEFDGWKAAESRPGKMDISYTEDDLVVAFMAYLRFIHGHELPVFDLKRPPNGPLPPRRRVVD
jgi:hypothetical protein